VNGIRSFRGAGRGFLLLLAWVITSPTWAAAPPRIVEGGVRIGFRGVRDKGQSRNGVWAPVQVTLKAGADDVTRDSYHLIVETTDGEAVPYVYSVPVPAIPANGEQIVFAYARPGSDGCAFTIKLRKADGQDVQTLPRIQRDPSSTQSEIIGVHDVLYLTVGSRLPALKQALKHPEKPGAPGEVAEEEEEGGSQRFAFVENVAGLPDRWFGYEGVDIVVLTTASDTFVDQLPQMGKARRDALLDWVRRGGRLVLSVGRNQPRVTRWLDRVPLVDAALKSKITRGSLPRLQLWGVAEQQPKPPLRQVEIAGVQLGPDAHGLVWEDGEAGDLEQRPIVLQSSCGLGRVVLVAFDLDAPPFSTWEGQAAFWKRLRDEIAPHQSAVNANQPIGPWGQGGELGMDLKRGLESFEEVPVISFGWVALFILFYIVLVGPLDYLLLKKVFKRLELTWITFPVLMLVVSAVAYATAYYVKGDDLRINKIDLVDIDLPRDRDLHREGQVYGRTWFTLFSPRIQNYTAGLEVAAPEWGGRWYEDDAPAPPVMVATLDGPEAALGGNSQSLFRHPYEYAADAGGLRRVPIPVWATRTFTSSWRVPLKDRDTADRPPPIKAELRVSRADENILSGSITNNLPAELQGVTLFYRGKWYLLGNLVPGESREVNPLFEGNVQKHELAEWFDPASGVLQPRSGSMPSSQQRAWLNLPSSLAFRRLLFHDLPGGSGQPNSGLRSLDESWRLQLQGEGARRRYREEVLLVGRTPPRSDRAEAVTRDGVSPTRLWLDELPGTRPQRPALSGYLQQETYVRIYIPLVRSP
jgi:hypothetical protein